MSNKEQRKELELLIVKSIEDVLSQKNSEASKKIKKTSLQASKAIAKKFLKAIKSITSIKSKAVKVARSPKKAANPKVNVPKAKLVAKPVKQVVKVSKPKLKK
jgi:hypothetical protein